MKKPEQRWMKNIKTGVVFHYDEAQVMDERRPWMVECSKDGKVVDSAEPKEIDRVMRLERENAELRAELAGIKAAKSDVAMYETELERLRAELASLKAGTGQDENPSEGAVKEEEAPAGGMTLAELREKARELGFQGVFRKSKAELEAMIAGLPAE